MRRGGLRGWFGRSLWARIALPSVLAALATTALLGLVLTATLRQQVQETTRQRLLSEARLLAQQARPLMPPLSNPDALQNLSADAKRYLGARVTIIAPDGRVLADSDADPASMENHAGRPEVRAALDGREASDIRFSDTLQAELLYAAAPVLPMDATKPPIAPGTTGALRLAVSMASLAESLAQTNRAVLLAALAAGLLAALVAAAIASATARPLARLTAQARRVRAGQSYDLSVPDRQDEIGQLGQALSEMAGTLHRQIDALNAEQARLAAVLSQMSDGVLIAGPDDRVELVNPAAGRIFGLAPEAAVGRTAVEVMRRHQLAGLLRACRETGETQQTTLEAGADRRFLQAIAAPLGGGLPGRVLLLIQDLTRVRRLELVRRDFISNVSHELRTPLASLKALTETLQEGALEDPPAARRFLGRMDTEIDTLTQLVRELLELARIESGQSPFNLAPANPCALLAGPVERMKLQAERAGLRLELACDPDLPAVLADAERIGQVVVNLVHNAVKFTPPGGSIWVEAAAGEGGATFTVRDTGVGIAAEDLERIFERFYKADRARSGGGTGLGLSIARHTVEAHGGRIWAESAPGQGSAFHFWLPAA